LGFEWGCSAAAQTATFNFDTGTPTLTVGRGLPLDQTSGGITAHFSAASGTFSVQSASSQGLVLSQFSGKYLSANANAAWGILDVQFSQQLTNISLTFATIQQAPIENETPIALIAYLDSTGTPPVGSATRAGTYGSDSFPMGTLTFSSGSPFNLVRIRVPVIQPLPSTGQASDFLVDTFTVQSSGVITYAITTSALPGAGGSTSGAGTYTSGTNVTVVATANPGYAFVNWTENGTPVSTSASYSFMASTNRTLVANFAPLNPKLNILLTAPDKVLLSWSSSLTGYVLQPNLVLGTTNWVNATDIVQVVDGQNQVIVSPLTGNCFYRLFHP
jgi:hypothetical protein